MIKAVIVDDESKAIQGLSWELSHFSDAVEVLQTFTNPDKAISYLNKNVAQVDCLFLDIQMPTMDGFQFLEKLSNKDFAVVITTAYDEYAIKAIKHEAVDYLLKPIDTDDLSKTINKIKKAASSYINIDKLEDIFRQFNADNGRKRITVSTDGKLVFLEENDIIFVESDGNYSTIFLENNQKLVLTKKLKEVNAMLPTNTFFRIHNSFVINLSKVKEFYRSEAYVVMSSNHKIPVARQRKLDFLEKL